MKQLKTQPKIFLVILLILIILLVVLLLGKFTYSFMAPDEGDDINTSGEITASGDTLIFSKGNALSLSATTDNFNLTTGNLSSTTNPTVKLVASSKTNNAVATYAAGFVISNNTYQYTTEEKTGELILTVKDESGATITSAEGLNYVTVNGISGFDVTNKIGAFTVAKDHSISTTSSTTGTTHTWTFTLTFVNFETDQSLNENANLAMNVILQKKGVTLGETCENQNMATCIKENYQLDPTLLLHNSSLVNGANDGSYRYAGSSASVNNYVCFGSNEETCPTDNLYRIIGVFGSNVKLIKSDYATATDLGKTADGVWSNPTNDLGGNYKGSQTTIARYYWDGTGANTSNNWTTSTLNTGTLNGTYLTNIGNEWASKIATTTWKVGGNTWTNIGQQNARTAYQNEIVSPAEATTANTKIGLMYVSEYMYAASTNYWTYKGLDSSGTDYRAAINDNWMHMGATEWTISRRSGNSDRAFRVYYTGSVGDYTVSYGAGVRPSFSLESSVVLKSGIGTMLNPFRIS